MMGRQDRENPAIAAAMRGDPVAVPEQVLRTWRITWADPVREPVEIRAHALSYDFNPDTPTVFQSAGGVQTVLAAYAWLLIEEVEPPATVAAGDPVGEPEYPHGDEVFKVVEVLTAARFTPGQGRTNDAFLAKAIVARLHED